MVSFFHVHYLCNPGIVHALFLLPNGSHN